MSDSPTSRPEHNSDRDQPFERDRFYVVGVGASAGGLEALEQMFKAMPDDTGMAFVIVQHLSPDFKSLMHELLARHTEMPIHRVHDGIEVVPNCLYLIPPKQQLVISDGKLRLTEKDPSLSLSLPIDHFFRSLARDAGNRSIAVVLSGTGSDGSRGLRDVHDVGGLVVAQSVESAKFDGMPKSAIDTGLVDVTVEPSEIPRILVRYAENPSGAALGVGDEGLVDETSLEQIFGLLQRRHKIDFSHYKPTTIGRRIDRRIQLNHDGDIDDYLRRIEDDPSELDRLYKDLLIGVTRFFRDREAFAVLRNDILPQLIETQGVGEEFRVWVAGCGTGEEAYSIAILIDECMKELRRHLRVKIFATDVHQASLDTAHAGIYAESSLEEMTAERREAYFDKVGMHYRVSSELREMVVFAPHNLIKDAPFTRLNLITCRNLLIYFRSMAQKRALSLFHFGLKTGGILFLGASESPGELGDEFEPLNDRWKVFRKIRDVRLLGDMRTPFPYQTPLNFGTTASHTAGRTISTDREMLAMYDQLLEEFMPPAVLVDEWSQVAQTFGGAGKFLKMSDGRISTNVLDLVEGDLKLALAGALRRAATSGRPITCERVRCSSPVGEIHVRLDVKPVTHRHGGKAFLITFEELDLPRPELSDGTQAMDLGEESRNRVDELEQELRYSKENLQAAVEELETSNEELQATNEELVASNEELQSTNEELHSVNEELYTVNAEYQKKISELTELTNDMNNLLVSTEVHTLFLDSQLCIRKFTPKMADVFNLVPHDLGRRIDSFAHSILCDDLSDKLNRVLKSGQLFEQRVTDKQQHHFLMRVLPYRASDAINGVVLTLIDVSTLVAAQDDVLRERERFERVIAANRDGVWDWPDVRSDEMWWSPACYRMLGYEQGEISSKYSVWVSLIHPEDQQKLRKTTIPFQDKCFVELHRDFEYRMKHKSGQYRWYHHRAIIDHDGQGKPFRMTGSVADIHDRKCSEMESVEEIRRRDDFLAMLSHELRNPMGAVLNAVQLLHVDDDQHLRTADSGLTAFAFDAIKIIDRQTKHMARLLDDLLDVARFGQSKIEFRKELVDLCELADDVLEAIRYEVNAKNQALNAKICDGPLCVFVDPARIKQAQVNLLTNASKYTPENEEIFYCVERSENEAVITVKDSGEGIPRALLGSIFDLFVQADNSLARPLGGMGVGLSLARTIVEAHEGSIAAESEGPGKGSSFQIRLPIREGIPTASPPAPHFTFQGCKLLLVEDNEDARTMLARGLQLQGFVVEQASDGREALTAFHSFRPEIAVIDIGLPGMSGYELVRRVRASEELSDVTLIALTGYGRQSDRQAALDAGFDTHLVKPLNPSELYAYISSRQKQRGHWNP